MSLDDELARLLRPCSMCDDKGYVVRDGVKVDCPHLPALPEPISSELFDRIIKITRPEMERRRSEHEVAEERRRLDNVAREKSEQRRQARIEVVMLVVGLIVSLTILAGVFGLIP